MQHISLLIGESVSLGEIIVLVSLFNHDKWLAFTQGGSYGPAVALPSGQTQLVVSQVSWSFHLRDIWIFVEYTCDIQLPVYPPVYLVYLSLREEVLWNCRIRQGSIMKYVL